MSNGMDPAVTAFCEADFKPGWTPEHAAVGQQRWLARGNSYASLPAYAYADRPLPVGFSMLSLLKWAYNQGQVGSCFANMGAAILQLIMAWRIRGGVPAKLFNPSRALIWYRTRVLDGSWGGWGDGGSIVNTFASLGEPPDGIGDCSEEDWPYRASHSWLERKPTDDVLEKADATRLVAIAKAPFEAETWKRLLFALDPIGIGIWWPYGWDQGQIDQYGRTTGIGPGTFGHALAVTGWITWEGHLYWEILNSHGEIYPLPPPEIQKQIVGYHATAGTKSHAFYARDDHLRQVFGYGNAESFTAADVKGWVKKPGNPIARGIAA